MTVLSIEKLERHHAVAQFDCGEDVLNQFLIQFAYPSQQANTSRTYVGMATENSLQILNNIWGP